MSDPSPETPERENAWKALAKRGQATLRIRDGSASLRLWSIVRQGRRVWLASFTARQRRGESLEQMVRRGLSEITKREVEGNPKPSPAEATRRKQRHLLRYSPETRPM